MAVKKSASSTKPKAKEAPAPKAKAVGVKSASAAKKETAPGKTSPAPKKSGAPKSSVAPKSPAVKTAAPKKSPAAAIKLTSTQTDLLGRVHGAGESGYLSGKKGEQRTLDALQERKLIKRGAKHKESGNYHYQVSSSGKKHVDSNPPAPAAPSGSGSSASNPPSSGGTS